MAYSRLRVAVQYVSGVHIALCYYVFQPLFSRMCEECRADAMTPFCTDEVLYEYREHIRTWCRVVVFCRPFNSRLVEGGPNNTCHSCTAVLASVASTRPTFSSSVFASISFTSAGTLPPSFTQQIRSRAATSRPRSWRAFSTTAMSGGKCGVFSTRDTPSPRNGLLVRSLPNSPSRGPSPKRPRTTQAVLRGINDSNISGQSTTPQIEWFKNTAISPGGQINADVNTLWGTSGNAANADTEWACSTSVATSTTSYHDGFSDLFATPKPGGPSRREGLQPRASYFRVAPVARQHADVSEGEFSFLMR